MRILIYLNVVKIEEIEAFYIQYIDMLCFGLSIQWRFLFHEQETNCLKGLINFVFIFETI